MKISYSKNYIKIYFFQILSIVLGFVSLFIVIPYLSSDQTTYGIYSVCISITLFLSYADLGFLGAGMKYAAECYSNDDRQGEMELVGFSHFILLVFVLLISCVFFFLSFYPELLIKDIKAGEQIHIAHSLLLTLAVFSPAIIVQRAVQMIFSIRLQDYIMQRIYIVGNLVKIISVFYFFGNQKYDIVGYFLFVQIINLICDAIGVLQAKRKFNYNFGFVFRQFRFNATIFNKVKGLAFSSIFVTLSWILYYELDSFAIGRILGAKEVAIYAIGFSMLSFFRSLIGVFFSPFSARFNHYIGEGKQEELKHFYNHILTIALPVIVFPIVAVVIFARPIVISWVGIEYERSVEIVRWLVLCNILAFISYPAGMLMTAYVRLKEIYIISFMMPIIYWGGIIFTIGSIGVESFAIFKLVAFVLSGIMYLWISLKFLEISMMKFLRRNIVPYLLPLLVMSISLFLLKDSFIFGKSKWYLLVNSSIMGGGVLMALSFSVLTIQPVKAYFVKTIKLIVNK